MFHMLFIGHLDTFDDFAHRLFRSITICMPLNWGKIFELLRWLWALIVSCRKNRLCLMDLSKRKLLQWSKFRFREIWIDILSFIHFILFIEVGFRLFMLPNKNLMGNQDIWKGKLWETGARYVVSIGTEHKRKHVHLMDAMHSLGFQVALQQYLKLGCGDLFHHHDIWGLFMYRSFIMACL